MEKNHYQTPKSDLKHKNEFKRSLWWKIYFIIITILTMIGYISALTDPNAGISEYISLVMWLVTTVGFFGFVFLKPIYKPQFWLQLLTSFIVFNVIYFFITDIDLKVGMSETWFYISNFISWALFLPMYYGLYAFSKPSNQIWSKV